jgi:hypothetical protein
MSSPECGLVCVEGKWNNRKKLMCPDIGGVSEKFLNESLPCWGVRSVDSLEKEEDKISDKKMKELFSKGFIENVKKHLHLMEDNAIKGTHERTWYSNRDLAMVILAYYQCETRKLDYVYGEIGDLISLHGLIPKETFKVIAGEPWFGKLKKRLPDVEERIGDYVIDITGINKR